MNGSYLALAARIQVASRDLHIAVDRAEMQLDKARTQSDDSFLDATALNLHGFYTAVEHIFEDIARTVDGAIPGGPSWHRELLVQMSAELADVRPSVLDRDTVRCLDEYRAFRHVVRNVYSFNLRPERVAELTESLRACHDAVVTGLQRLVTFLNETAR